MNKMVDMQQAFDAVCKYFHFGNAIECNRLYKALEEAYELTVQPELKWIPVESEPPEFGKEVLISHKGAVSIDWLTQSEGWAYFFMSGAAIADIDAWMPLPKPYERSEDGQNV